MRNTCFASAAAAVAASKKKSAKRKRAKSKRKSECSLRPGMRVHGLWPDEDSVGVAEDGTGGSWFEGVVVSVDYEEETVHIKYDDGDSDTAVKWIHTRILDDIPNDG